MTPREIAEKLHDHYCVQECRWHDKPGTILAGEAEITEAIDAATKPLHVEIERLKEEMFERDMALSDEWAKIQKGIEEKAESAVARAEARNKALVGALRAAGEAIHSEYCSERHHSECQKVDAALASSEPKESLPKASEGA